MIKLINALGATKTLPIGVGWRSIPHDRNVPIERLHGKGVRVGREAITPRSFILQGSIWYPSVSQTEEEADALIAFLQHSPIEVYRKHTDDRYMVAYPTSIPQDWVNGRELNIRINMIAPDPFWYGAEVTSDSLTIEVGGNAPTYPLLTLTASGNVTVTNTLTEQVVEVTAILNDVIVVDNDRMEVTVNGVKKLSAVSDAWLINGFNLLPNTNILTVSNAVLQTKYKPRWY